MSLPPPPIKAWSDIPPVWQRWFQDLFVRAGGSTGSLVVINDDGSVAGELAESFAALEDRVLAVVPERQNVSGLEGRIAALEAQVATSRVPPDVSSLEARVAAVEAQHAGLRASPDLSPLAARIAELEAHVASRADSRTAELMKRVDDLERVIHA